MAINKRKSIVIAFLTVLFVGIIWWKLRLSEKTSETHGANAVNPAASMSADAKKAPVMLSGSASKLEWEQAFKQKEMEREDALRKMLNTRINFYGKVVDQHGRPVSGASTSYIVTTLSWSGSPTQSGPPTDAAGSFSIVGIYGPQLRVMVDHPNYYKTDSANKQFTYAGQVAAGAPDIPTANNPAIFVLRSKGKAESLIHESFQLHLPLDGSPVNVDLRTGKIGSSGDSVILSLHSDGNKLPLNQYHPFDWGFKIEVSGGGVQERQDKFQFQAPADGYKNERLYSSAGSLPLEKWREGIDDEFFLLLSSGDCARIKVHMVAWKGACKIESFLNPNPNSRNLEYDPSQQSAAQ